MADNGEIRESIDEVFDEIERSFVAVQLAERRCFKLMRALYTDPGTSEEERRLILAALAELPVARLPPLAPVAASGIPAAFQAAPAGARSRRQRPRPS